MELEGNIGNRGFKGRGTLMRHSSHRVKVLFLYMCVLRWYHSMEFSHGEIVTIRNYIAILRKHRKPEK